MPRYFITNPSEVDRMEGLAEKDDMTMDAVLTDPTTDEQWQRVLDGPFPKGPIKTFLIRFPVPDAETLLQVCGTCTELEHVAAAASYLTRDVDARWKLAELIEKLLEKEALSPRVETLLVSGLSETPLDHEAGVGMHGKEIERQYKLSVRCAEKSAAIRKQANRHRPWWRRLRFI